MFDFVAAVNDVGLYVSWNSVEQDVLDYDLHYTAAEDGTYILPLDTIMSDVSSRNTTAKLTSTFS